MSNIPPCSSRDPRAETAQDVWFESEVRPHEPALRSYLRRRFPTFYDVDDVVQESFLKVFLVWQKGRLTSAKGLLFAVAGNITVSLFRKRKYISDSSASRLVSPGGVLDDADVRETVCNRDELAVISEAIASLPPRCRQVVVLRLFRHRECAEIAENLGIAEQTVRVLLARGMKKCGESLRKRGVTGKHE